MADEEDITEPSGADADQEQENVTTEPSKDDSGEEDASTTEEDKEGEDDAADQDAAQSEDAEGDEEDGDDGEADGEGVDYDSLAVPEGYTINEQDLGEFKTIASKMNEGKGLSQKDAQSLVDLRMSILKRGQAYWETKFSEWRGEIASDTEIGGENFEKQTIPRVLAAAEKYGGSEMVKLVKTNKFYGENPHLVRLLSRVGATLEEGTIERGGKARDTVDTADTLYPDD